jgi:hypothetical protein
VTRRVWPAISAAPASLARSWWLIVSGCAGLIGNPAPNPQRWRDDELAIRANRPRATAPRINSSRRATPRRRTAEGDGTGTTNAGLSPGVRSHLQRFRRTPDVKATSASHAMASKGVPAQVGGQPTRTGVGQTRSAPAMVSGHLVCAQRAPGRAGCSVPTTPGRWRHQKWPRMGERRHRSWSCARECPRDVRGPLGATSRSDGGANDPWAVEGGTDTLRMTEMRFGIQGTKRPCKRHDEGDPMLG